MARLNGIQHSIAINSSTFLLNLENDLVKELDTILSQEGNYGLSNLELTG